MRTWDPLWRDPESNDNADYLASIRRMIVASINWIEAHPDFKPQWQEPNKRSLMRAAGVPDDMAEDDIAIVANWEDVYWPRNSFTRAWFRAIDEACGGGGGSAFMMQKAIAAGMLLLATGWDEFNQFMMQEPSGRVSDG